jgi:hypothetical protein
MPFCNGTHLHSDHQRICSLFVADNISMFAK